MVNIQRKRIQLLLFVIGLVALSFTAEKCRELIGEDLSSKSGKFTIFDCLDMSSGTFACAIKEGVKLYTYNIRSAHVENARIVAIEQALLDALGQGMLPKEATKHAQKEGSKAAKLASRKAKRILGPIVSSGWDFFEALYYGGTITEGVLRGCGTLVGAYGGGFFWEQSLGRFGYLVGSQVGSWFGGRIGLMVYDIISGIHVLIQYVNPAMAESHERSDLYASSDAFYAAPDVHEERVAEVLDHSDSYEIPSSELS